ncbi:MAG: hypothetical protein WBE34_09305 [Candidatus Nitrosopolaris sp.]
MIRFTRLGIRSYKKLFSHLTSGIIILILLCSAILTNIVYAQLYLKPDPSGINNSNTTTSRSQQQHGIKITSPTKDQQMQVGRDLVIDNINSAYTNSRNSNSVSLTISLTSTLICGKIEQYNLSFFANKSIV